jgi:hypothetical protein
MSYLNTTFTPVPVSSTLHYLKMPWIPGSSSSSGCPINNKFSNIFDWYLLIQDLVAGTSLLLTGMFLCNHKNLQRFPYRLYGWTCIIEGMFLVNTQLVRIHMCELKIHFFQVIAAKQIIQLRTLVYGPQSQWY